ncbi:hypothetical protein Taro_000173 [Colocasia esculenta]|uniref:Uncharacterized protein n=1 Tax=Colocasia esculenta TaxID=4460 RepID=A0A843TC73_COLES|nr:hypothetical protein [Colocasia esculenta]
METYGLELQERRKKLDGSSSPRFLLLLGLFSTSKNHFTRARVDHKDLRGAVPVVRHCFSHGCSLSLVVTTGFSVPTLWRSGMLGACVVRLWSHGVALVFRELLCLGGCVVRVCFRIVLLWPDPSCRSWHCSSCFRMWLTPLVLRESSLA